VLSRGANTYARLLLGIPVHDSTGGFRAYRATTLQKIGLDDVVSHGYCFQVDLTLRTVRQGLQVTEAPITFVERTRGSSKMSRAIIAEAFQRVTVWGLEYRLGRLTGRRPA
jgi:dolichol-phosphate mannosyltransferase